MKLAEVAELFVMIKRAYPNFDGSSDNVRFWYQYLADTPFEHAKANLDRHIREERYPPTIADLRRPLEAKDPETVYHEQLRRESEEHFRRLDEFARTAVPAPPEVKERMRQLAARRAYGG